MLQKIEMWKTLILQAEMFCFGGYIFVDRKSIAKPILGALVCALGIVYLLGM